jgi:hypothetical protein
MTNRLTNQRGSSSPRPAWGRTFAISTAILFLISSVFPIVAGLSQDTSSFPKLWGILDVAIALLLAIMAFVVYGLAHNKVNKQVEETTYRAYRVLIHVLFAFILIFFLFGDRITWINGLPGIEWRFWLLLYLLPEWFGVMGNSMGKSSE